MKFFKCSNFGKISLINLTFFKMQSLASSSHLTQSLDPTHHSVIEPNPTHDSCQKIATNPTRPDPVQPIPWIDLSHLTHVHLYCVYRVSQKVSCCTVIDISKARQ